ncbi:MAG: DegT/DnrJ/EryC1/StrS family aminotransferase [Planctomycetota bacterium]
MPKFPLIRPDVPPIGDWAPVLEEAYRAGRFSNFGPLSLRLEGILAETWGGPDSVCVAASSGTAALAAPLIARGITGRVILPAFTFPGTLSAIRMAGAEPFLADVSPVDWRLSADTLVRGLDATGARAAVVLCPFGQRSDFRVHARHLGDRGGVLVVDNAAGLGIAREPLETQPWCFEACSLHVTKPFAVGEGGVVFAHRSQEEGLRRALNFGLTPGRPADLHGWGINGKLSELHAAVGLAAACGFANRLGRRRAIVMRYVEALAGFAGIVACTDPSAATWQFFPLLLPTPEAADRFVAEAAARGMEIRRYYAPALSFMPDVDRLGPCPVAEDLATRMCCAPVYADATAEEEAEMAGVFRASLAAAIKGPASGAGRS